MLVTTPDAKNKNLCRLDFITSEDGQINQVRRSIVDQLSAKDVQFNVSSLEVAGNKELRTIIFDPSFTRPVDYDRVAATEISKMLLSTKGVLSFTSAFTQVIDANKDQNIALFAKVMKNQYVVDQTAVTLAYDSAAGDGEGSFGFKVTTLDKVGTFEVLNDEIEHFGKVKLNKTEEFYIKESTVEGKTSAIIGNAIGTPSQTTDDKSSGAGDNTRVTSSDKAGSKNNLKSLVMNNKTATAGASLFALAAFGAIASSSSNTSRTRSGATVVYGGSLKEDKVRVGGELLTRSEAEELYKSF